MLYSGKRKQSYPDGQYTAGQIESVLRSCNIKVGNEIDTHFLVFCPFHYNTHTPACEVDKNNGMFLCFSCGESGSIIDIVMKVTNRNYFESMRLINSKKTNIDIEKEINLTIDKNNETPEYDMAVIHRLNQNLLSDARAQEYFNGRHIGSSAQKELLLGYSIKQDMVTVPVFDIDNRCLGFVGRSIEGKEFKNSPGLPKSKVLYNLNRSKHQRIAVVESSFDAIRLWQLGIFAIATLGASVSRAQIALLSHYANSIIIIPDRDDAGTKMVDKITNNLTHKDIEILQLPHGKDIGDFDDHSITKLLKFSGKNLILAV